MKKLAPPIAAAAAVLALIGVAGASAPAAPAAPVAAVAGPLDPGPYHHRLNGLVGTWRAVKTNYVLDPSAPIVSRDITVKVGWITKTGDRFLQERTEGTLGGDRYYRMGVLGFSTIDRRYEWTTFDSVTPTAMTYRGPALSAVPSVITIPGEFTDPGIFGPEYLGKTIPMRTVITLGRRPVFELFFTPPGQAERLADKVVYTRRLA
ncbi:DUF1579 family protein [Actinomadura fibrosa]|uniref:DUF1579 family protein n=1 Tax=Actinomadura fibrosa TaxID=111802 RepID=A0ABW2XDL9_9ACTN|nr:DUF1579 family protein [Actinomadura fibrosa]